MERLIKIAIDGGYMIFTGWYPTRPNPVEDTEYKLVFLDPLFWECLAKGSGVSMYIMDFAREQFFNEIFRQEGDEPRGLDSAVKFLNDCLSAVDI